MVRTPPENNQSRVETERSGLNSANSMSLLHGMREVSYSELLIRINDLSRERVIMLVRARS